jgi:hypothetical protein
MPAMMATTAVTTSKRRTVNLAGIAHRQSVPTAMSTRPSTTNVNKNSAPFMPLTIAGGHRPTNVLAPRSPPASAAVRMRVWMANSQNTFYVVAGFGSPFLPLLRLR